MDVAVTDTDAMSALDRFVARSRRRQGRRREPPSPTTPRRTTRDCGSGAWTTRRVLAGAVGVHRDAQPVGRADHRGHRTGSRAGVRRHARRGVVPRRGAELRRPRPRVVRDRRRRGRGDRRCRRGRRPHGPHLGRPARSRRRSCVVAARVRGTARGRRRGIPARHRRRDGRLPGDGLARRGVVGMRRRLRTRGRGGASRAAPAQGPRRRRRLPVRRESGATSVPTPRPSSTRWTRSPPSAPSAPPTTRSRGRSTGSPPPISTR